MSKPKRRKGKRSGFLRRAVGRWAWRQVTNWADTQRKRIKKAVAPKVIHASARERAWQRRYPDPRRTPPLTETIERVEEWMGSFTVEFDTGWRVPFEVDYHSRTGLRDAAYDAGEREHGQMIRSRLIVDIEPTNDLAEQMILEDR